MALNWGGDNQPAPMPPPTPGGGGWPVGSAHSTERRVTWAPLPGQACLWSSLLCVNNVRPKMARDKEAIKAVISLVARGGRDRPTLTAAAALMGGGLIMCIARIRTTPAVCTAWEGAVREDCRPCRQGKMLGPDDLACSSPPPANPVCPHLLR